MKYVIVSIKNSTYLFKDVLLNKIEHEYICCDPNLNINDCF